MAILIGLNRGGTGKDNSQSSGGVVVQESQGGPLIVSQRLPAVDGSLLTNLPASAGTVGLEGRPGIDGDDAVDAMFVPGKDGRDGVGLQGPPSFADDGDDSFAVPILVGSRGEAGPMTVGWPGDDGDDAVFMPSLAIQGVPGRDAIPAWPGDDGDDALTIVGLQGDKGEPGQFTIGQDGEDAELVFAVPGASGTPGTDGRNGAQPVELLRLMSYALGRIKFLETALAIEYKERDLAVPKEVKLLTGLGYLPNGIEGVV